MQQHHYLQPFNDSGLSLHDFNVLDDHLLSPIKQNDPLLSNYTTYDENVMDSFNWIKSIQKIKRNNHLKIN